MAEKTYAVGVDIGGTSVRVGLVDENLAVESFVKLPQQEVFTSETDSTGELADFLLRYLSRYAKSKQVVGMALGFPAAMNKQRSMVLNAPNIKGIDRHDLPKKIGSRFSFPVFFEKDVSLLFYCDLALLQLEKEGVIAAFYLGTGIGNVISIEGKLLTGKNGVACEVGHLPTWGKTELCSCGNEGCIENYASGRALAALKEAAFPNIPMEKLFIEAAEDKRLIRFVEGLSIPIASELNIIDPDRVILGGGLVAMQGFPKKYLESRIRFHCRKPYPADNLCFYYSHPAGENGVLGGALYVREQLQQRRE